MNARSHQAAGITRSVSEPVYAKDILSDMDLNLCSLSTYGAWMMTLLYLWDGKIDRISHTIKDWSKLWRCSPSQAQVCILELAEKSVCRVEIDTIDGKVDAQTCLNTFHETVGNNRVTLVSRRLERRLVARNQSTTRVKRHRERKRNATRNPQTPLSSPSPSLSSSLSPSASAKGDEGTPPTAAWKTLPSEHTLKEAIAYFHASHRDAPKAPAMALEALLGRFPAAKRAEALNTFALHVAGDAVVMKPLIQKLQNYLEHAGNGSKQNATPTFARKKAAEEELAKLRNTNHPSDEQAEHMRQLKAVIAECNREMIGQ